MSQQDHVNNNRRPPNNHPRRINGRSPHSLSSKHGSIPHRQYHPMSANNASIRSQQNSQRRQSNPHKSRQPLSSQSVPHRRLNQHKSRHTSLSQRGPRNKRKPSIPTYLE